MGLKKMIFKTFLALGVSLQAQELVWLEVGPGEKPQMTLVNNNAVVSIFKEDAVSGYLSLATYNDVTGGFDKDVVLNGNFYGPAYIDTYANEPFFVFHNHDLNGGGASVVFSDGATWLEEDASNDGHDGWDSDIKVMSENEIYVSYIDAIPFSGLGLEFSVFNGSFWNVDTVGTTLLEYGFGSTLELKKDKTPFVFYYNSTNDALEVAYKENSNWTVENLDSTGSPGFFPSSCMVEDTSYIAYYNRIGTYKAELKLGKLTPNKTWSSVVLDTLNDVVYTFKGRHPVDIQFDSDLIIVASDIKQINKYEVDLQLVFKNKKSLYTSPDSDTTLMQTLSYKIDDLGYEHLVFSYEHDNIEYTKYGANIPGIWLPEITKESELILYPNPVVQSFSINHSGLITIYNGTGKQVEKKTVEKGEVISVSNLASGIYFLKHQQQNLSFVIK